MGVRPVKVAVVLLCEEICVPVFAVITGSMTRRVATSWHPTPPGISCAFLKYRVVTWPRIVYHFLS